MRSYVAGYTVICLVRNCLKKKKKIFPFWLSISQRLSFLLTNMESPGIMSDTLICCVHVGLDLGRTGNFPWTRGDGSLLVGSCPVAAGVLDATAWTSGLLSIHFFTWPMVLTLPIFLISLLSFTPPAQGATISIRPCPLPVHLGIGFLCRCLLFSPSSLLVAITGPPAFVSTLCSPPLLPVSCIFVLVSPVFPFARGNAGLLASWTPGALGLLKVLQRHSRVMFPFGVLPGARGVVVSLPLGFSIPAHVLQGSTVASLCFSGAVGARYVICPAFSGSLGTCRLGVTLACFSGLGAGAGGTLMVVVGELLSSWSVSLPCVLLPSTRGPSCPVISPRELNGSHYFGWRRGQFRGREGDRGWRSRRWLPVRYRKSGKAWGWNGYFVLWTWEANSGE